jgi:hypothetical protein
MAFLNHQDRLLLLGLLVSAVATTLQLRAAQCDTTNPELTCKVEDVGRVSVTHYRSKSTTSTSRTLVWLQRQYPHIFGTAPPFDKGIALLVGVANYKHLHPLPNVRNDLLRMRDYLLVQEEFDDVYILQDEDVTSTAINNLFFGYFGRKEVVGDQDRFLFYYSGHGSNETGIGQMQFSQADPQSYKADANLSVTNWKDWGKVLKAKQALFLFDACALGTEIVTKGRSESDADLLRNLSQDKSRIAFAATRGGEAAHADEDTSYFTLEFLRVVQSAKADFGNVGFMTIAGIGDVMQAKLHELAEQHGYKWYYTSPTELDEVKYPGTFVFLNPKVPEDPESRFEKLTTQSISKGTPSTSPITPTATPIPTSWLIFMLISCLSIVLVVLALAIRARSRHYDNGVGVLAKALCDQQIVTCLKSEAEVREWVKFDDKVYGKGVITFELLVGWWHSYKKGVYALFFNDDIHGIFAIWPLKNSAFNKILEGEKSEKEITARDIEIEAESKGCSDWYISGFAVVKKLRSTPRVVEFLREALKQWIENSRLNFPMRVCAFGFSKIGQNALRNSGFSLQARLERNKGGWPIFFLEVLRRSDLEVRLRRLEDALEKIQVASHQKARPLRS